MSITECDRKFLPTWLCGCLRFPVEYKMRKRDNRPNFFSVSVALAGYFLDPLPGFDSDSYEIDVSAIGTPGPGDIGTPAADDEPSESGDAGTGGSDSSESEESDWHKRLI